MLTGGCHCGNVTVTFISAHPETLAVRECQCTFCRAHGTRNTTDPDGRLDLTVRDPAELSRYRFGLGTTDFLICRRCGVYVAAYIEVDGQGYATLNVNVLGDQSAFDRPAQPVVYDAEDAVTRIARRKSRWTPARIR